ncbi:MAG TPA: tautomerase family protein [Rhizomicrobium sp.]|jgi:4-oxalocrotonate tautomerase
MPVIVAHILKGRSVEIKRRLASALTATVADALDVQPQSIQVLIEEHERENWAAGGELYSDRQVEPKSDELDLDAFFRKPVETKAPAKPAAKAPAQKTPAKSRQRR